MALLDATRVVTELNEKHRSVKQRTKDEALEFLRKYRFRFDGQFTVVDSNREAIFHDSMKRIPFPYRLLLISEFDEIPKHQVIGRTRGTIRWIDFLSSDYLLIDEAFYFGTSPPGTGWIRFNIAPFYHFEPWDWYILAEAHNEIHGLEESKIQSLVDQLREDGWSYIEGRYTLSEWARD